MQPLFFSNGYLNNNSLNDFNKYLYSIENLLAMPMPVPYFGPEMCIRIDHQIKLLCVRINRFILECFLFGKTSEIKECSSYTFIKYLSKNLKKITNNLKNNIPPKNQKIIDYMASNTWTVFIFSESLSDNLKFLNSKISPQSPQPLRKKTYSSITKGNCYGI